jgi:hypothetical protein
LATDAQTGFYLLYIANLAGRGQHLSNSAAGAECDAGPPLLHWKHPAWSMKRSAYF